MRYLEKTEFLDLEYVKFMNDSISAVGRISLTYFSANFPKFLRHVLIHAWLLDLLLSVIPYTYSIVAPTERRRPSTCLCVLWSAVFPVDFWCDFVNLLVLAFNHGSHVGASSHSSGEIVSGNTPTLKGRSEEAGMVREMGEEFRLNLSAE